MQLFKFLPLIIMIKLKVKKNKINRKTIRLKKINKYFNPTLLKKRLKLINQIKFLKCIVNFNVYKYLYFF